jgi:hypothetical protein
VVVPRRERGSGSRQRGAFTDGFASSSRKVTAPPRVIAQNKMLLNSFVSGVTFQRNASNLQSGAATGR